MKKDKLEFTYDYKKLYVFKNGRKILELSGAELKHFKWFVCKIVSLDYLSKKEVLKNE